LFPDFETYKKLEPWTNKLYSPEYEDDKVPLPNDDLNYPLNEQINRLE
jgi:hypothetical protein